MGSIIQSGNKVAPTSHGFGTQAVLGLGMYKTLILTPAQVISSHLLADRLHGLKSQFPSTLLQVYFGVCTHTHTTKEASCKQQEVPPESTSEMGCLGMQHSANVHPKQYICLLLRFKLYEDVEVNTSKAREVCMESSHPAGV